jgi:hypothetical protein
VLSVSSVVKLWLGPRIGRPRGKKKLWTGWGGRGSLASDRGELNWRVRAWERVPGKARPGTGQTTSRGRPDRVPGASRGVPANGRDGAARASEGGRFCCASDGEAVALWGEAVARGEGRKRCGGGELQVLMNSRKWLGSAPERCVCCAVGGRRGASDRAVAGRGGCARSRREAWSCEAFPTPLLLELRAGRRSAGASFPWMLRQAGEKVRAFLQTEDGPRRGTKLHEGRSCEPAGRSGRAGGMIRS